uniref:Uncharacterized protein n=1 Tax=Chenopodium quinoa TaxID=63459 RepID=A0A803MCU3_CHEQI
MLSTNLKFPFPSIIGTHSQLSLRRRVSSASGFHHSSSARETRGWCFILIKICESLVWLEVPKDADAALQSPFVPRVGTVMAGGPSLSQRAGAADERLEVVESRLQSIEDKLTD